MPELDEDTSNAPVEQTPPIVDQVSPIADEVLLAAVELARSALLEITTESTIGAPAGHIVEGENALSLLFECTMLGYPGWYWTVSLGRADGEEPTVLEAELMPGDAALLAPDWVPWSERLAEYQASQEALRAEQTERRAQDDSSADDADESDDTDESEDDADDESDDFDDSDIDGVDIDALHEDPDDAEDADDSDDVDFEAAEIRAAELAALDVEDDESDDSEGDSDQGGPDQPHTVRGRHLAEEQ